MTDRRDPQRRRGRAPLLDARTLRIMTLAVRRGNRLSVAARIARVSPRTVEEWMRRGRGRDRRPAERRYVEFVEAIELARAQAEADAVEVIWRAIPRRPDVAFWWLAVQSEDWRRHRLRPAAATSSRASPAPAAPPMGTVVMTVPVEEIERRVGEITAERERAARA